MRPVGGEPNTAPFPRPSQGEDGDAYATRMLVSPVFTRDVGRRRRLLAYGGCLAAVICVAYLVMVLVSVTASPVGRPANSADVSAATTTATQAAPSTAPTPSPVLRVTTRPRPAVQAPVQKSTAPPVGPSATATATPTASASATATKKPKSKTCAAPPVSALPKTASSVAG